MPRLLSCSITVAVAATFGVSTPIASAVQPKTTKSIRANAGIGPVDIADAKRTLDKRLGSGKSTGFRDRFRYRASGGTIDVYFRTNKNGDVSAASKAYMVQTRSPVFRMGSITTATPYDAALEALAETNWVSLDCRESQGYAYLYRSRPGRETTFAYFTGQNASVTVRSVGRGDGGGLPTACTPLD